jgi:hypothetical protein
MMPGTATFSYPLPFMSNNAPIFVLPEDSSGFRLNQESFAEWYASWRRVKLPKLALVGSTGLS